MARFTVSLALLIIISHILAAQPMMKCGSEPVFSPVIANMSKRADYVARFDVIRETPVNITVTSTDGNEPLGMFIEETEANLSRLAFPRDTFGMQLYFQYRVDSSITTHYVQFLGTDTIRIVIPGIPPVARRCYIETRSVDDSRRTLTLEGNIFTYDSVTRPADITVERLFGGKGPEGNTSILDNNYPELETEIRIASALYDRDRFRGSVRELTDDRFASLRYFIHFRVVRLHKGSHRYEVL